MDNFVAGNTYTNLNGSTYYLEKSLKMGICGSGGRETDGRFGRTESRCTRTG